ncbi:hypothetical protein ACO0LL_18790 [Undibacterium sp. TC4M20W]|uniref:hypothetical protein n=1 Tax=unclassified Undibacterium TaxID=2630295 RepID=UPI003BF32309
MQDDLTALETWASNKPASRHKKNGSPYAPRKQRKNIRGKQGRIKKQKASMFNKLRTNTRLKAKADGNGLEAGFYSRVARRCINMGYGKGLWRVGVTPCMKIDGFWDYQIQVPQNKVSFLNCMNSIRSKQFYCQK